MLTPYYYNAYTMLMRFSPLLPPPKEPNVKRIEEWVKSLLLPGQSAVVVSTTHYVDEHPQLAVALVSL